MGGCWMMSLGAEEVPLEEDMIGACRNEVFQDPGGIDCVVRVRGGILRVKDWSSVGFLSGVGPRISPLAEQMQCCEGTFRVFRYNRPSRRLFKHFSFQGPNPL